MGSSWSYKSNKTDNPPNYVPADAWKEIAFDDSSWPIGTGLFGFDTGIAQYAPWTIGTHITNPRSDVGGTAGVAGSGPLSSYFRTHFTWSSPTANVVLRFTNYVDDGILVFLNGQELFSFNVPPERPLAWNILTLPNGANPLGEGVPIITNLPADLLITGDNVIAVELHQQANTSSDDIFGMSLTGIIPFAPTNLMVLQPTNRTILQNRTSTLLCIADASPDPTFQWYEDGIEIPGATASSLTLSNANIGTSISNYFCRVTNPLGSFDTRVAVVIYTADTAPPVALRASQSGAFDSVVVEINEALDSFTGVDPFAYDVLDGSGNRLGVSSVTLGAGGTIVTLALSAPMAEDTAYRVAIADPDLGESAPSDIAGNFMLKTELPFRSWTSTACGGVMFEVYDTADVPGGNAVVGLTGHPNFPNNPRETFRLVSFDMREAYPDDSHEQYGARMRGVFIPPTSGNWKFYMRGDDGAEVWFNPNGPGAGGRTLICSQGGFIGGAFAETAPGTRTSAPIPLTGGQGYYIEALYKEGTGGDYCQVAAKLDTDPTDPAIMLPIPGSMLGTPAAPANVGGTFTITQQPASQNTVPNSTVVFTVGTSTDVPLCYQWLRDGVAIPGAIGPQYRLVTALTDDNARFSVRVSIIGGITLTSAEATLSVGPDIVRPTVVSVARDAAGSLVVTFSEAMGPSAAVAANYTINGVAASSATLTSPTVATVVPASPLEGGGCTLNQVRISGVSDVATVPNLINPNPTTVSLSAPLVLLAMNATWKYEDTGTDLGTSWRDTGFIDTAWLSGPAPLGFEPGTPQVPPVATPIGATTATNTAYFRTHFTVGIAPSAILFIQLNHIADDGAVYYLNGMEARRVRMPDAPAVIDFTTLATAGGPEPANGTHTVETTTLPTTHLVAGDNVLAVELHPNAVASSDSEFAAQLVAVLCVPNLVIERVGSQVRLTWSDAAYRLETAPSPTGPWASQAGASGVTLSASSGNAFFRLVTP